jgi:hypothetical protein
VGPAGGIDLESSTVQSSRENRREKSSGKCRHVSGLDSQFNHTLSDVFMISAHSGVFNRRFCRPDAFGKDVDD